MDRIVVFTVEEQVTVEKCLTLIRRRKPRAYPRVQANLEALSELARAISRYPSVLDSGRLGKRPRSVDTLVRLLCQSGENGRLLHVPTRAVVGKGFIIAKIHFFYLVRYVLEPFLVLRRRAGKLLEHVIENIFTLMSEDAFLALLEDPAISPGLRQKAASRLAHIWEWRLDRNIKEYAPVLFSLWQARRNLRPLYGTMMGVSELYQLSRSIHPVWAGFLQEHAAVGATIQSLEEFLFNLSWEELQAVREEMDRRGLKVIDRRQLAAMVGQRHAYSFFDASDPRRMYEFFQQRKANALFRRRASLPGPDATIEELLLRHLLARDSLESA